MRFRGRFLVRSFFLVIVYFVIFEFREFIFIFFRGLVVFCGRFISLYGKVVILGSIVLYIGYVGVGG